MAKVDVQTSTRCLNRECLGQLRHTPLLGCLQIVNVQHEHAIVLSDGHAVVLWVFLVPAFYLHKIGCGNKLPVLQSRETQTSVGGAYTSVPLGHCGGNCLKVGNAGELLNAFATFFWTKIYW